MLSNLDKLCRLLWASALVALPVTSFRWFPLLGDDTLVRPLALYPLALLLPLLLIQWSRAARPFPWTGSTILAALFALAVLVVTSLGVLFDPISLRGQTYSGRAVRAIATLVIGLAFFVSAAWMDRDEDDLRFTFRWLLVGLGLNLAWSGLQAVTFYTGLLNKEMVTHWQLAFSMRELVRTNRVSGLAYEPAWLAGQLATIYIPALFAAALTKTRFTRAKWLETVLLVLCVLLLLATYSRGGILITVAVAVLTFMLVGRAHARAAWMWFVDGFREGMAAWIVRLGLIAVLAGVLIGAFAFLSQKNYFRRLWEISADNLTEYMVDINAGARSAYSTGALAAFESHPVTGVGLGASGFWIYENLPDWSLTTVPEIARQLNPESRLYPNPKNIYIRLLAETGLTGFVLFFVFQLSVLGDALSALRRDQLLRFLGIAGLFAWLAIALHNVTQDSFATPNIWLIPGILAGMSAYLSTSQKEPS
jgi:O-antigen ligase